MKKIFTLAIASMIAIASFAQTSVQTKAVRTKKLVQATSVMAPVKAELKGEAATLEADRAAKAAAAQEDARLAERQAPVLKANGFKQVQLDQSIKTSQLLRVVSVNKPFKSAAQTSSVDLTADMFHNWTAADATGEISGTTVYPAYVLNESTGLPYGDGNVYYLNYADLSAYSKLVITVTEGTPRCCFNRLVDNGTVEAETPRDAAYQTVEGNVYTIDIAKIVADKGFAHLHCIKGANWVNTTVTSMVLETASTVNVEKDANGIITSVTGGETKAYQRTAGMAYYPNNSQVAMANQTGYVTVVEDGNKVYIKDPITRYTQGSWVEGTKNGNTITVATQQPLAYNAQYGATLSLRYGVITSAGNITAADTYNSEITFSVEGDVWTLQNTSAYTGSSDDYFIGVIWDDDDSFSGYGDAETELVYDPDYVAPSNELVELPAGAEVQSWFYSMKDKNSAKLSGNVNIAFVDDDIYLQICPNFPTAWIKGTNDNGVVTFKKLQYIGVYNGSMDMWMVGNTEDGALADFVMNYDAEAKTLTAVNYMFENAAADRIYYLGMYTDMAIYAEALAEPTAVTGDPVEAPYYNFFDTASDFAQFGVLDMNEDGKTWTLVSGTARITYNSSMSADDWMISPAIKLEGGKPYAFSVDAKAYSASYPERFEVKIGTVAKPSQLSTTVIPATDVKTGTFTTYSGSICVEETGYYHVGIHGISDPDQFYLFIDNFKVFDGGSPMPVTDLSLVAGDELEGTLSFTMPTLNAGGQALDAEGLTYTYVLNGEAVAEQVAAPGEEVSLPVTLKAGRNVVTVVAVNAAGASENAEASVYVSAILECPISIDLTEAESLEPFTIIDANADNKTWNFYNGFTQYNYHSSNDADDYLITPNIRLKGGRTYILGYDAFAYSANYPEAVEVLVGKEATVEGMTQTIVEPYTVAYNADPREVEFQVAEDGVYYIGFHALSPADGFYLRLRYINLEMGPDPQAPAACEVKVIPGLKGADNAVVQVTTPTKNMEGNAVAPLTKVELMRDGQLVKTFNNPPTGVTLSYRDTELTTGVHTWTAVAYNEFENGSKAEASAFIGVDAPGNVDATIVDQKTSIKINWEPVTEGQNGGYIDPEGLTYEIYTVVETILGASIDQKIGETTGTSFDVPMNTDEGEFAFAYYAMRAVNATGASSYVLTNSIIIGAPDELPYLESAANGSLNHSLWLETANGEGSWGLTNQMSYDEDGGAFVFQAEAEGDESSLITGKITMEGATNPILSFKGVAYGATLKIEIQKRNGTVTTLKQCSELNFDDWTTVTVDLNNYKHQDIVMVRFTATGEEEGGIVLVDDIQIRDVLDHNLVLGLTAPKKVQKGEKVNVAVKVTNEGANAATGYTVKVNDQEKTESATLAPGASKTYEFALATSIFDEAESLEIAASVEYAAELKPADNSDEVEVVLVASKAAPVLNLNAEATEGGVKLTWNTEDEAAAAPAADSETVEDFESYEVGIFADGEMCGDWKAVDLSKGMAYGWQSTSIVWPYTGETFAFGIIDVEEAGLSSTIAPTSGTKTMIFFSETDQNGSGIPSSKYIISPELGGNAQTITFNAQIITAQYGPELIDIVASSTDDAVASFSVVESFAISEEGMQEYSVELPAGTKYFAIHYKSTDVFGIFIDDITYSVNAAPAVASSFNVYKNQVKVANVEAKEYVDSTDESCVYSVTALYGETESAPVSVEYTSTGITIISSEKAFNVYSVDGRLVRENVVKVSDLEAGVYVINNQKITVK